MIERIIKMKYLNQEIEDELIRLGAKLIRFVDISHLSKEQNRQFPNAVVFVLPLTAAFVQEVCNTPDYVAARIADNYNFADDEYFLTEERAGELADKLAAFLTDKGYKALSQSDASLLNEGLFNAETHTSVLPNKTVAILGGLGWIGKNNLLITPEYGSAQCIGTLLTDAPLETILCEPLSSKCGKCSVCVEICEKQVLKGTMWSREVTRDGIVNVYGCSTCLKCLVHCPRTRKYANNMLESI